MEKIKITQESLEAKRLNADIQEWIEDNGLERIQASPMSETFDLWECPGGHVWNFEQIKNAFEDEKHEQAQEAMADQGPS